MWQAATVRGLERGSLGSEGRRGWELKLELAQTGFGCEPLEVKKGKERWCCFMGI